MEYDILILGGGPAGLTAAIYAARGGQRAAVLEKQFCGGQAVKTDLLENYPGFPEGVSGPDLAMQMQAQAERLGAEIINDEALSFSGELGKFRVQCAGGEWSAKALILAPGASARTLGLAEEESYIGRGVSYCATCDGALFRGKPVAVVGGGDAAAGEAVYLSRFAQKVFMVHRRGELRAAQMLQDRVLKNPKIQMVWHSTVEGIEGVPAMESIRVRNVQTGAEESLPVNALFVAVGNIPQTEAFRQAVELDEYGYIKTAENLATSRPGVFAAGDARQTLMRQVVSAAADGALAAQSAIELVNML